MFHVVPAYSRHQYLASQAEALAAEAAAKAMQAEYLAAEALRQEEEALKARLYDIEQRKKYARPSSLAYPQPPSYAGWDAPAAAPISPFAITHRPAPAPREPSITHTKLLEERRARLAAEEELKRKDKELAALKAQQQFFCVRPRVVVPDSVQPRPLPRGPAGCQRGPCRAQASAPAPPSHPAHPNASDANAFSNLIRELFVHQAHTPDPHQSTLPKVPPSQKAVPEFKPEAPKAPAGPQAFDLMANLKARYKVENDDEMRDTIRALAESLAPEPTPAAAGSLIDQLKARHHKEDDQEIKDTIQATLNSLNDLGLGLFHLTATSTPPTASSPSASSSTAAKGKAKEDSVPSSPSSSFSLQKVEKIAASFHALESEFAFPSQLDFVSSWTDSSTAISRLAFTARNHPVRFYEQSLLALLADLDLIESNGDMALRNTRKKVVTSIEEALDNLEKEIIGRWQSSVAKAKAASPTTPASTQTQPEAAHPSEGAEVAREATPSSPSSEPLTIDIADASPAPAPAPVESAAPVQAEEPQPTSTAVDTAEERSSDSQVLGDEPLEHPTEQASDLNEGIHEQAFDDSQLTVKDFSNVEKVDEAFQSGSTSEAGDVVSLSPDFGTSPLVPEQLAEIAVEDPESESEPFLSAQPSQFTVPAKKPRKVEIEDLGSDWSDVDA